MGAVKSDCCGSSSLAVSDMVVYLGRPSSAGALLDREFE